MSSLAALIAARTRTPTLQAWLDGRRWLGARRASAQQELGQGVAGGQISGREPPITPRTGMTIRWSWGYNNVVIAGFTGFVTTPTIASYPNVWDIQVADALWPATRESGPIATSPLNNITAREAIIQILAQGGVTRVDIPDIGFPSDPGTPWLLGQLTPVSRENTTALAFAQEIAQTAGFWLYADAGGTVRARQVERRPSSSPFATYARGDNLLVQGAPTRTQQGDQVRNRITVKGAKTGVEGAQLFDTFIATHALTPGVISEQSFEMGLLEYIADVTAVAERLTALWNRVPNTIDFRVKLDPRVSVGMTLGIQDSAIGYSNRQTFFLYRGQQSVDLATGAAEMTLTLDGGVGDSGYSQNPPPVAVLTVALDKETIDGDAVTVVTVDGSASYAQDEGEIVSWAFATSSTTYSGSPTVSPGPNTSPTFQFVFEDTESPVEISLTVTATNSKTDLATLTVDLAGDTLTIPDRERLSIAAGAAWLATTDGGATYASDTDTTTLVPQVGAGVWDTAPINDALTYGALAAGGTELRQTLDALVSVPTVINTASGSQVALYVNPRNGARVWRAVGDTVQRSIDGGQTFTSWGAPLPGTDVRCIIEDPALDNSVFALAGADMYQSLGDGAPGWSVFYAGPVGATARWMVRAESGGITWIAYTGTFSGSPLQRVEGPLGVTFPVVSPVVSEIRALEISDMVSPAAPVLLAADQEARLWRIDGLTGLSVTQSAETMPAGTIVQHMVHSRTAKIVYLADFDSVVSGTGAVRKWLYESDVLLPFLPLATGQQGHMVGIIGAPQLQIAATLYMLTVGVTAGTGGVYAYTQAGGWQLRNSGLPAGDVLYGFYIAANPASAQQLIALIHTNTAGDIEIDSGTIRSVGGTTSPWWYSGDAGLTWQEIIVPAVSLPSTPRAFMVEWTTDGRWILGWQSGAVDHTTIVTGTVTTPGTPATNTTYSAPWFGPGQGGEIVVMQNFKVGDASNDLLHYLTTGGSYQTPAGSSPGDLGNPLPERDPASRVVAIGTGGLGTGGSTLYVSSDYRAAQPVAKTPGLRNVTWATHGLYASGTLAFSRITDPTGTAAHELVLPEYFQATQIDWVRADRQARQIVAIISNNDRVFLYDGTSAFVLPTPISQADLAMRIEVTT